MKISTDNCESLESILDLSDPVQKEDYEFTEACVRIFLFSRFPERKEYALRKLRDFYNPNLKVHKIESGGLTRAYISLTKSEEAFFFIEKYRLEGPFLEPAPTRDEELLYNSK